MPPSIESASPEDRVPFNDLARLDAELGADLRAAIERVVSSGWFVLGPETEAFEREFSAYCGSEGCVGVGNGTDALELALRAAWCAPGREVILAGNAGGYAALACLAAGATPVLADIDPTKPALDPESVAAAVTRRTCAVVVTHLYGIVADVDAIRDVLPSGVIVIEDAAQAHGGWAGDRRVGSLGDLAAFSFYPTKNLGALGDAGAVTANDTELLDRLRLLHQYGWTSRYNATLAGGRNSRMDEIQAAALRVKLDVLDAHNKVRIATAERYRQELGTRVPFVHRGPEGYVGHLCVVRTHERDQLRTHLDQLGVSTAVHFPVPDQRQPAIATACSTPVPLPHTDEACREVLSLPCFVGLTDAEVDHVVDAVERCA